MSILENVINGATSQFGREFGRAGANIILKGSNSYNINDSRYDGRIKPSDNKIIKALKEIRKVDFVTTNKANVSRLIEITNIINDNIIFEGDNTLSCIDDYFNLIDVYDDKFEHGRILIDDDYSDKSLDFLIEKRNNYKKTLEKFNNDIKENLKSKYLILENNKRIKSKAIKWGFPVWGFSGIMHFYLKNNILGVISLLTSWTIIVPIAHYLKHHSFISKELSLSILIIFLVIPFLNILYYCHTLTLSEEEFDNIYNSQYVKMKKIINEL
jgi:hypothetical protein